jgi:phage shock protein C
MIKKNNKKLVRLSNEGWVGGVCAGIGETYNIDANVVRLIFLACILLGGFGLFLYILLWIIMPNKKGS